MLLLILKKNRYLLGNKKMIPSSSVFPWMIAKYWPTDQVLLELSCFNSVTLPCIQPSFLPSFTSVTHVELSNRQFSAWQSLWFLTQLSQAIWACPVFEKNQTMSFSISDWKYFLLIHQLNWIFQTRKLQN